MISWFQAFAFKWVNLQRLRVGDPFGVRQHREDHRVLDRVARVRRPNVHGVRPIENELMGRLRPIENKLTDGPPPFALRSPLSKATTNWVR